MFSHDKAFKNEGISVSIDARNVSMLVLTGVLRVPETGSKMDEKDRPEGGFERSTNTKLAL